MRPRWLRKSKRVEPYTQLAYIYDYVMRHVNYYEWAYYLTRLFRKSQGEVRTVLDISCGTASLGIELSELGYSYAGFDSSRDMIRVAQQKLLTRKAAFPVWIGSMFAFEVREPHDAVVCIYDSLNYCLNESACKLVFSQAAAALRPGGIFIFDVSTKRNSTRNFRSYYDRDRTPEFEYVRQSYYQWAVRKQINEFHILWRHQTHWYREVHQQRIYRLDELQRFIQNNLFEIVGLYSGFSFRPATERSERVHFLLRKKAE